MTEVSSQTALLDRMLIRERLELYMSALDRLDRELVIDCFTPDADLEYDVKPERYKGGAEFFEALAQVFARFSSTNHCMSNTVIELSGDTARAESRATAVLVDKEGTNISVRGVRYLDDLVRVGEHWKLRRRVHQPLWQYDLEGTACNLPGLTSRT